jgi:hypothetical protein
MVDKDTGLLSRVASPLVKRRVCALHDLEERRRQTVQMLERSPTSSGFCNMPPLGGIG